MTHKQIFKFFLLCSFGLINAEEVTSQGTCYTKQCAETAEMFRKNMDPSYLPCHDFYQFMCGNFKKWHQLGPGENRKSAFSIRGKYINNRILEIMKNNEYDNLYSVQKARLFFQNCIDEDTIERFGEIPIPSELNNIGLPVRPPFNLAIKQSYDFSRLLAKMHRYLPFTSFLFDVSIRADEKDFRKNRIFFGHTPAIFQFTSEEQERELEVFAFRKHFDVKDIEDMKKLHREVLTKLIKEVVHYMNQSTNVKYSKKTNDIIDRRITEVVDFLIELLETKRLENPEEEGPFGQITKVTLTELQEITDEILKSEKGQIRINWLDYMETFFEGIYGNVGEIFQKNEPILIKHIEQFKAVLKLVSKTSEKVLVSAIWWTVTQSVAAYSTKELRNFYYNYYAQINRTERLPREKVCLSAVKNTFSHLFGHLLIRTENNIQVQNELTDMLTNIKDSYEETITQSKWLDSGTKMAALNKLKYISHRISHQKWMANPFMMETIYQRMVVLRGLHYASIRSNRSEMLERQLVAWRVDNNLKMGLPPTIAWEVNAGYSPDFNTIDVQLGILGRPFYGLGLHALNYGSIGSIISHELGHGFDKNGKEYDSWGKKKQWWKKESADEYNERTKCFIDFYEKIEIPEVGRRVNGKLTIGENTADFLGFTQGLKAYRKYVEKHGPEKLLPDFEHYTPEKLYTMAFTNTYCEITTPSYMRWQLERDEHAPGIARVLGVLKNSVEFAEIWKCSTKTQMNPENKCSLW